MKIRSKALSFNDVLIVPGFTEAASRKDVDLSVDFMGERLTLPVLSAPMDTVTNAPLAIALHKAGGLACLHRFHPIGDNIKEFTEITEATSRSPIVSVGLNDQERMSALYKAGARKFLLDVAHGGMRSVADWAQTVTTEYPGIRIMLGNYSTSEQIRSVRSGLTFKDDVYWRMGVGGGSACTTRIKTGCGVPTLASVLDIAGPENAYAHGKIIADGGMKTPGDVAKALAAGASVVMLGGMLAGTAESPGDLMYEMIMGDSDTHKTMAQIKEYGEKHGTRPMFKDTPVGKKFRGSAAASSYKDQGKEWATAEGEEFLVPYKGPVANILAEIEGGLRSAMTYVGVNNLTELSKYATFVEITNNGWEESKAHGKKS